MVPSLVMPWKPATITIWSAAMAFRTRSARTSVILALLCTESVTMPTWAPVNDNGVVALGDDGHGKQRDRDLLARREQHVHFAVGRLGCDLRARSTSSSVTCPIAETTATTSSPACLRPMRRRATARIRSGAADRGPAELGDDERHERPFGSPHRPIGSERTALPAR